jgi:hypothetical protein
MFNDTFVIKDSTFNIICNCPKPDELQCSKKNIAWPTDINYKFKTPNEENSRSYPNNYFNEEGHIVK